MTPRSLTLEQQRLALHHPGIKEEGSVLPWSRGGSTRSWICEAQSGEIMEAHTGVVEVHFGVVEAHPVIIDVQSP